MLAVVMIVNDQSHDIASLVIQSVVAVRSRRPGQSIGWHALVESQGQGGGLVPCHWHTEGDTIEMGPVDARLVGGAGRAIDRPLLEEVNLWDESKQTHKERDAIISWAQAFNQS